MSAVSDRIEGREYAEELLGLSEAGNRSEAFQMGFWRAVANIATEHHQTPSTKPQASTMSDDEAARFERRKIGFGRHADVTYGEVPIGYLIWLHGSSVELSKYLRSDRGQRRQDTEGSD